MTYSGYIKDHPAYCLDHQCRKFHVLKYIMIERKFQALSWQRKKSFLTNDRKKKPYPSDQVKRQIKYQCWHVNKHTRPWDGSFIFPWGIYKAAAFLIPDQVRHMSVGTIIQLFMASLTASKLSRQFWSSKKQRARASDFSSNLKTTGSVTIYL